MLRVHRGEGRGRGKGKGNEPNMTAGPIWDLVKSMHDKTTLGHIEVLIEKTRRRKKLEHHEAACFAKVLKDLLKKPESIPTYILQDCDALLRRYPELSDCCQVELTYLLRFCNAMRIGKELIPASLHKQLLLNLCSLAEGSGKVYVTGSGAKKETTVRVGIYERECGIVKTRRMRNKKNKP